MLQSIYSNINFKNRSVTTSHINLGLSVIYELLANLISLSFISIDTLLLLNNLVLYIETS